MMTLAEEFTLSPGESVTLAYAFMYVPKDFSEQALLENISAAILTRCLRTRWKNGATRECVDIPGEEWINRELTWHNAYLRQAMTYPTLQGAYTVAGGHYQYLMGLQGAPRDQLQHSLSYIYPTPLSPESIYCSRYGDVPEGELPYATNGQGLLFSFVMASDLQFMLLAYIGEYVLATGDKDFKREIYRIP